MKAQIISFRCVLRGKMGQFISSSFNHEVLTHFEAGTREMLPGLALGLQDLHKGEKRRVCLSAEQAYGFYDPELVIEVARDKLRAYSTVDIGDKVMIEDEDEHARSFRVIHLAGRTVTLDGNHPLAGQDLTFEIETLEARDATVAEIDENLHKTGERFLH